MNFTDTRAYLLLANSTSSFEIKSSYFAIGRALDSDLMLCDDRSVSKAHAAIIRTNQGYILRDFESLNGTTVNDRRVGGQVDLRHGDKIWIGYTCFLFVECSARQQVRVA
jgi:pSer/pThr/pTyr-binding forkhead associated (FHA) protein